MEAHKSAVEAVASRTRQLFETRTPFRVYHGSTNSTRRSQRRLDNTVDTSGLNRVVHVDTAKKTALVEPNVPMDALVEATLEHGLVPLVVMEFPGITVGGGFSGTSGESSSFRHGSFDFTINWIEIVLPDGEVARASKTEQPDLFWGAASAFGTLGVVTLLEVQLRDARQYVELQYRHIEDFDQVVKTLQEETSEGTPNDYVDAITFSLSSTIICTGRLVDALPHGSNPQRFLRSRDPWFSVHAQRIQKRFLADPSATITDHIPLRDYLFRYDRGAFWTGRYAFRYFLTPFNRITRFLLNPFMHTRVMYRALHQSGLSDYYVVQDVGVPYSSATDLAIWLDQHLSIYPLWLCPLRTRREGGPAAHHGLHAEFADPDRTPDALLNFGVWGPASFNRRECVRMNRDLEGAVQRLGGKKWLYAQAFYTEDEFWAHYDRKAYDTLRERYHAGHLPSVYDKVKVDVDAEEAAANASWAALMLVMLWRVWPLAGLYGVYKAVMGGDYLLQKTKQEKAEGGGKKSV
ncbi:FAD binding domain protein [Cercophora newfieldiana]|uniref:Delta(24)-sterol reductase n=1 Tax=Cercophora newfieldiana TaxID=92897 RepID=A0AA39XXB3_9PEZI|nr:FAD binding domain protein [Cercophora newfieldiana]